MVAVILGMALASVGQLIPLGMDSRAVVVEGPAVASCQTCVGTSSPVTNLIVQLQTSPDRHARERAARTLRDVEWRRHPEVPGALAFSLMKDPARQVRFEAAESLTRMRACGPAVHLALSRAATSDSSLLTRLQARKGLRTMRNRCETACNVCEAGGPAVLMPGVESPVVGDELAPASTDGEPIEPMEPDLDRPAPLESTPLEGPRGSTRAPLDEPKPRAEPGPSLDSSVKPLRDLGSPPPPPAEELAPLPDPDAAAARPKPQAGRNPPRPRVAVSRPLFPRLFSGGRSR